MPYFLISMSKCWSGFSNHKIIKISFSKILDIQIKTESTVTSTIRGTPDESVMQAGGAIRMQLLNYATRNHNSHVAFAVFVLSYL